MQLRTTTSRIVLGRIILGLALASSASALTGCMYTRESLYAQSTVVGEGVYVRVKDAHVSGERVVVRTSMQNQSNRTIVVHRDELSLRLADGTTISGRGNGARGHHSRRPIVIRPGQSKTVKVDFRAPANTEVSMAHLVLGGVQVRGEREPRTLGEIALASDHAMLPISRSRASAGDESQADDRAASDGQDGAVDAVEPGSESEASEGDEGDDDAQPEIEEPAADESWHVGGG